MVRKRARLGRAVKASQRQLSALRGSFASFGFLLLTAPCNDVDPRGLALGPAAFDASLSLQAGLQNKHYPFLIGSGPTSLQDAVGNLCGRSYGHEALFRIPAHMRIVRAG